MNIDEEFEQLAVREQQASEKIWRLEQELTVLQTTLNSAKNNEIIESLKLRLENQHLVVAYCRARRQFLVHEHWLKTASEK